MNVINNFKEKVKEGRKLFFLCPCVDPFLLIAPHLTLPWSIELTLSLLLPNQYPFIAPSIWPCSSVEEQHQSYPKFLSVPVAPISIT